MSDYLIWSAQHDAWWGPGRFGYVRETSRAGLYTRAEALAICGEALPDGVREGRLSEIPVRLDDLREALNASRFADYAGKLKP